MELVLDPEVRELLDRWVRAVESKDLEALSGVFRRGHDIAVFWSNGERNIGWEEVRRHIESDFRKDVDLRMEVEDLRWIPQGDAAGVLSHRYRITLSQGGESMTFRRLATMSLHRDPAGWRVAALHVSNFQTPETPPT